MADPKANWLERAILTVGGLLLIYPTANTDAMGVTLFVVAVALHWLRVRNK